MEQSQQPNQEFDDIRGIKEPKTGKGKNRLKSMLDGSYLGDDEFLNRLPYILFLGFLGILYIANTFHAESLLRDRKKLEMEMRELQPEAISISSQLMHLSNQSEVAKLCREHELGLKESLDPPYKIVLDFGDVRWIKRKSID